MKLILVKSFWGMEGALRDKVRRIAEAGYDACEGQPANLGTVGEFVPLMREFKLAYVPMILTEAADNSVAGHLADFRAKLEKALAYEPLQITAHSGRDSWTFAEQEAFFGEALALERRCGIHINHETHRSRVMFTPWTTATLLRHFPDLHLTADFSHWVNVCERLPEDQADNLALAIARARHVHGRVGYEQGPQVNDPRAPEWAGHLAAHETWWDAIVRTRQQAGAKTFTFNPEFGPPTYMPTLPHTQQPLVNLWEVCLWMAQRFKQRFANLSA
jgi:sugar phosphate isomerase/epimerase